MTTGFYLVGQWFVSAHCPGKQFSETSSAFGLGRIYGEMAKLGLRYFLKEGHGSSRNFIEL
jgi:hypothetical protein